MQLVAVSHNAKSRMAGMRHSVLFEEISKAHTCATGDSPAAFRNRRVTGFDTIDPKIKPMGSDNINLGTADKAALVAIIRIF